MVLIPDHCLLFLLLIYFKHAMHEIHFRISTRVCGWGGDIVGEFWLSVAIGLTWFLVVSDISFLMPFAVVLHVPKGKRGCDTLVETPTYFCTLRYGCLLPYVLGCSV